MSGWRNTTASTACAADSCGASHCPRTRRAAACSGKASILTVTSAGNRTSPVVRGVWVMESLLGAHVPQPPPGVETDLNENPDGHGRCRYASGWKRIARTRPAPPVIGSMDPLGFAMENFDLLGTLAR